MNYIGVDLHKKMITACVMDERLAVRSRKTLHCDAPDRIADFFRQFQPCRAVVEATASYHRIVALVEPLVKEAATITK